MSIMNKWDQILKYYWNNKFINEINIKQIYEYIIIYY